MFITKNRADASGHLATYVVDSNIDVARLRVTKKGQKAWAAWSKNLPQKMQVLASPAGSWARWSGPDGKEQWRLVCGAGQDAYLIDAVGGTRRSLGKRPTMNFGRRVEIDWQDGRHAKLGPVRRAVCRLALIDGRSAHLSVEALARDTGGLPSMPYLWLALAPWLGDDIETLGLPVEMRLDFAGEEGGSATMRLDALEPIDVRKDAFDLPAGLKEITPHQHRQRRTGKQPDDVSTTTNIESRTSGVGMGPALFTGTGPETVKVVFNQTLLDTVFADIRTASSYIAGFRGQRFTIPTSDWFSQVVQAAPVPADGQTPSVIPALLVRAFLIQICPMLRSIGLSETNRDVAAAVETLQNPDNKRRLETFLSALSRARLQPAFEQLLERVIPGWGPSSPAADDNNDVVCLALLLEDLGPPFASHPFVRLAGAWYGTLLPMLNVRPRYRTRQEIEDAVAVFHANGQVTIDGLAELIDINLDNFEHAITFGNVPLFTPPVYVDAADLRTIGQLHPWFKQLKDIRFGFTTQFTLTGAAVSCDIDITPTVSAAAAALGFFCPSCLLSLFMTGSAAASVQDARFPAFIYVEQDPLRLNEPRWRVIFAEPQFGDVDASVALIGFNQFLTLVLSVVGSTVGDFVLEEILKSFGSELSDAADGFLQHIPLLDADTIARLGRQPELAFPPSEQSRVAYDAPPRVAGGYQLETFRQATRGMGRVLEFPAAGGTLDSDLALVLGSNRAYKLRNDVVWPGYRGIFETRKPDGSVSQIDWWTEARTVMPQRPPQAQFAPPSGVLLIPQNVGQKWWTFGTVLHVGIGFLGWRDLADSPANQPVADVMVHAWCRGEAIETEIVMYEQCEDVTHLAAGLLGQARIPGSRPPVPGDPAGPLVANGGRGTVRRVYGGPSGVTLSGRYLRRGEGALGPDGGQAGPGWADDSTVGYWFEPDGRTPLPDDPGPEPVPGTMLCEYVVTTTARQRQTWMEASVEFPLPVHVGLTETVSFQSLADFQFLPAIRSALSENFPSPRNVNLNLFATGPLETLNRSANREWIQELLVSRAIETATRTGQSSVGPFHYDYGINFVPQLVPERLQPPLLLLRLESVTTWPHGASSKNLAFKWRLEQPLLGRA